MGPSDQLPDSNAPQPEPQSAEAILRVLGHDLEILRHQVSGYLSNDIVHLQAKKQRLMADIEALEGDFETLHAQHQQLQTTYAEGLSQQQIAQQQAWAKRLAIALATHLQGRLETALATAYPNALQAAPPEAAISPLTNASQGLAALDATLQTTLASLQHDLTSYQSSISQQLNRMQSVEQQGEAILEALVARLSQQLQSQMVPPPKISAPSRNGHSTLPPKSSALAGPVLPPSPYRAPQFDPGYPGSEASLPGHAPLPQASAPRPPASLLRSQPSTAAAPPSEASRRSSPTNLQLGLLMVVLSTLALSLHNVTVGVIGYGGQLLGRIPVAEVLPLTIPNSLLLLWLRMVVVLPLLVLIAPRLYPGVGRDLRQIFHRDYRRPLMHGVASGFFLFLSQVLIYKAIADVGPSVAVTLLFMYPLITVPLAWYHFNRRPTPLSLVVMFTITMGIVFTALPRIYTDLDGNGVSLWGVGAALLASIAFALYLIHMEKCFRLELHPVPTSLLQFSTIFILTSLTLIVGSFFGLDPGEPTRPLGLYLGAGLLGLLTLLGYLFYNYSVERLGASEASIVAASGPVVTAILAYLITPGEKSALLFIQWMGVILVTLGVIFQSKERMDGQRLEDKRLEDKRRSAIPFSTGQRP